MPTESLPSIVASYSPDTVKSRARATLMLAIERIHNELASDNEYTLGELSQVAGSLGRVSGIATDEGDRSALTVTIVREKPPLPLDEVAPPNSLRANEIAHLALPDRTVTHDGDAATSDDAAP